MTEQHPVFGELDGLKKDIEASTTGLDSKLQQEQEKSLQLIEEARQTPTENERKLESQSKTLEQQLAETQQQRDDYKKQLDDVQVNIRQTRTWWREVMQKRGINIASILFYFGVMAAIGGLIYIYGTSPQQIATTQPEPATPGFSRGPAATT